MVLSRYELELNAGSRPPLRKICTQDAPASSPMVLCVSNITWSAGGITDDGMPIEPHPELEVTDGWYRLRAQVDESLARAVRKGVLRVGRKIGVAGARVCIRFFSRLHIPRRNKIMLSISVGSCRQSEKILRRFWMRITLHGWSSRVIRRIWLHGMRSWGSRQVLVSPR